MPKAKSRIKKPTQSPKASTANSTPGRKLKKTTYRSFRLSKRVKSTLGQPASSWRIFREGYLHIKASWRLFLGITVIYLLLTILLVKGFGNQLGISELKTALQDELGNATTSFGTGLSLFSVLLTSSGSSANPTAGIYQMVLMVITSLAFIWGLRQTQSGNRVTVKQAFYNGMFPLVPFLLVLLVVCLQLLPVFLGLLVYSAVITGGIAVTIAEKVIWVLFVGGLALLSLYMLTSSLLALYIVTLPDMTPMKALRSARSIVRYRRWTVMRKVVALPIILLIISAIIMLPIIIYVTPLAEWAFFFLNMLMLAIVHSYMYALYRQLL